jgi:hypothetical protein
MIPGITPPGLGDTDGMILGIMTMAGTTMDGMVDIMVIVPTSM